MCAPILLLWHIRTIVIASAHLTSQPESLPCCIGTGKLEHMVDCPANVIGLDWGVDIKAARHQLAPGATVQGNLDPMILFGSEEVRLSGEIQV